MGIDRKNDKEERKQAIFDGMSSRGKKYILNKVGYDKWDPFQEPKDPIDIRKDKTKRTAKMLFREFLYSRPKEMDYSNTYARAILDMAIGIVNDDERYLAMYDFSLWYHELLDRQVTNKEKG